jgi:hypothetical protein
MHLWRTAGEEEVRLDKNSKKDRVYRDAGSGEGTITEEIYASR